MSHCGSHVRTELSVQCKLLLLATGKLHLGSQQHSAQVLQKPDELGQKAGGDRAIQRPVIPAQAQLKDQPGQKLRSIPTTLQARPRDSQDGDLRRIDDRCVPGFADSSQRGNGEASAVEIRRLSWPARAAVVSLTTSLAISTIPRRCTSRITGTRSGRPDSEPESGRCRRQRRDLGDGLQLRFQLAPGGCLR
jgi:hypothetical protein